MNIDESTLKKILLDGGYITSKDVKDSENYSKNHKSSFLEYFLVEDLLSPDIVGQAISESFKVQYSDLNSNIPSQDQILKIPEDIAKKYRVVLFKENKDLLIFATDNPLDKDSVHALQQIFPSKKMTMTFSLSEDIDYILTFYRKTLDTRFSKILEEKKQVAPEIVEQIIEDAISLKASDVHLEPQKTNAVVRFRIDGVLQDAGQIPREYYENIVNKIKVESKLRIDEHFRSQDGAIRFVNKNITTPVDLRVSIIPTLDGEKIVIRILSSYIRELTLKDIGLPSDLQEQIVLSSKKPFGMILVTGPTGSGKTTTLYSLLKQLNTRQVNITTIEDPVEYKIEGINQIQANSQTNLSFADGLRAVARQDPNIIFVGEIRDQETADIAINAALTGHLLLSTFHANNAATAVPRFIDMGVESFLVGSTLELVISQRLVRRICNSCKMSYEVSKKDFEHIDSKIISYFTTKKQILYKGKGCTVCNHTGYTGRIGIFEYLTTSPELQDLISKSPSTKDVTDLIRSQGFKSMFEDGIEKVKNGDTTLEELLRIMPPEK